MNMIDKEQANIVATAIGLGDKHMKAEEYDEAAYEYARAMDNGSVSGWNKLLHMTRNYLAIGGFLNIGLEYNYGLTIGRDRLNEVHSYLFIYVFHKVKASDIKSYGVGALCNDREAKGTIHVRRFEKV